MNHGIDPITNLSMSKVPSLWLGKLATLNVARPAERGAAPHKPLMLLTVIDLIESGDIPDGWVKFDVHLVSRFRDYWELVLGTHACCRALAQLEIDPRLPHPVEQAGNMRAGDAGRICPHSKESSLLVAARL